MHRTVNHPPRTWHSPITLPLISQEIGSSGAYYQPGKNLSETGEKRALVTSISRLTAKIDNGRILHNIIYH